MRVYSLGGTAPRNTSVSVPRLMPEKSVRTSTWSFPEKLSVTGRISAVPGAPVQNARARRSGGAWLNELSSWGFAPA
jgi:hypothetical protein